MQVALGASENTVGRLWVTLVTLKGSIDQLYAFQLSDGVYKRKMFTPLKG